MVEWKFADVLEALAAAQPDAEAIIQGKRVITYAALDRMADAVADRLLAAGLGHQSKIALFTHNCPEYLIGCFAAFKAGMVPFNGNYRYSVEEIIELFDNADAGAAIFHVDYLEAIDAVRARLPRVKLWLAIGAGHTQLPTWAENFAEATARKSNTRPVMGPWRRSGDDLLILYTGGTTGKPRGVMWRQHVLMGVFEGSANRALGVAAAESLEHLVSRIINAEHPRPRTLVACPLMHGTGEFAALIALKLGGTVALLTRMPFDAVELWDEAERLKISNVVVVGMAFCDPMLKALEAEPGRWDLSSVRIIRSSGTIWSAENKQRLLKYTPNAFTLDSFGSSESGGMGVAITRPGELSQIATFKPDATCAVFTEDGRRVRPGSGERGMIATKGLLPEGYYGDPVKTAQTFKIIENERWCLAGDWAEILADGSLKLIGRGSVCINSGGEKIFPEEVEEVIKQDAAVRDAAVVGIPDGRFGERVCAIIELEAGAQTDEQQLATHVRAHLAGYKVPRVWLFEDSALRQDNGKLSYAALRERAIRVAGGSR